VTIVSETVKMTTALHPQWTTTHISKYHEIGSFSELTQTHLPDLVDTQGHPNRQQTLTTLKLQNSNHQHHHWIQWSQKSWSASKKVELA